MDEVQFARMKHGLEAMATISATLTCGCRWRRTTKPAPVVEFVRAGHWTACEKHGDVRVARLTQYLDEDATR